MGVIVRLIRRLLLHPHPSKLKEVPKILLQVMGVPVHLSYLQASQRPAGLYSDCKRSEADGPDKGNQTSPVPGRPVPSRFSPCKTHSREMAQTSGFDPTTQVKTCCDCKMFDIANSVACLNEENGPGGMPSHKTLSVSPQGTETISAHLEWWQNPTNMMKGADLHPKDHSIQLFTDASNEG